MRLQRSAQKDSRLKRIAEIWDTEDYRVASKRAERLSLHDALHWMEAIAIGIDKSIQDYRKHGEMDSLLDLRKGISHMQAFTENLIAREENFLN